MIDKMILDYYVDRKRRNYPTEEDSKKLDLLDDLFQYSDWIDKVGKEKYESIMHFLGVPQDDIIKYYKEFCEMKESFSDQYVNIYPEITRNNSNG